MSTKVEIKSSKKVQFQTNIKLTKYISSFYPTGFRTNVAFFFSSKMLAEGKEKRKR